VVLELVKDGGGEEGEEQKERKEHKNYGDNTAAEDDGIVRRGGERMAEERAKTEQAVSVLVFVFVGGVPHGASPPDHLRHRRRRWQRRRCKFLLN